MSAEISKSDYCIVYNQKSGRGHNKGDAATLSKKLGGINVFPISQYEQPNVSQRPIQIIYAGDGTISSISNRERESGEKPLFIIAGGGSENHLRKVLTQRGHVINTTNIFSGEALRDSVCQYYPSIVEGYGRFLVNAGFGTIETTWAKHLEKIREYLPAFVASYIAYMSALIELFPDNISLNTVVTNNPTGPLKIPIDSKLFDEQVLQIEIEGKPFDKFVKSLVAPIFWRLGITMPKGLFRVAVGAELDMAINSSGVVNLDGENVKVSGDLKSTRLVRSKESLQMVALGR
jgi:hypothetical protein